MAEPIPMTIDDVLCQSSPAVLVEITGTKGSTPREAGTFMLVAAEDVRGTIGGGNLEFVAIAEARAMLRADENSRSLSVTLGPDSGQCCGGVVELRLSRADEAVLAALRARLLAEKAAYPDVFVFGAGHVGRALAAALSPLPFRTVVIETRKDELSGLAAMVETRLAAMPEGLVGDIRPGGAAVILTHDHGLDFLIAGEALQRSDLAYVGMIGSKTKRGVFGHWLLREGRPPDRIDRLVLPIGGGAVKDKRPEVIAALVAAELLQALL